MGDFNFEALNYALMDHDNRLCPKDKPKINNSYIKSIFVQGGLLNEKQIFFSPELNNLIGIRGSGKSSVLEILRYALNIPFGAQVVDKEYKDDLIKHVLKSGGKAVVEIVNRQGETYRIERIYGQKEDIYKGDALQRGITLDAILRQPVYFGQKDLSNKNADFENDLVNKLVGGKLNDVQTKIDQQKQEILRMINELKGLNNLSRLKKETETAKANAEYKLNTFKEKGIAEKLQLQTSFESDMNWLQNRKSNIANYSGDLQSIIQNYENSLTIPVRSAANTEIFNGANDLIRKLEADFDHLKVILANTQKIDADFQILIDKFSAKKEELKEEFAKIKREINIPELNPDDFININRELEISKLKLIEIEKSEERRIEFGKQLDVSITRLNDLWHERFVLLQNEVGKINETGGKLSIEIVYKGRKDKFRDKLQDVFNGSGIRGGMYDEIAGLYADFIDMFKDEFRKLSELLTESQFVDFKDRFNSALYDLLAYTVENKIIIKFDGKPLKEHSLGQRASALILFLLSQKENDILIIDQPEDDLDNQTIYEDVIREIKRLKGRMQFIFATHNANIPVLGDSEMLVSCRCSKPEDLKGTIPELFKQGMRFLEGGLLHVQQGQGFNSIGILEISPVVLEEILQNALMHRDYFKNAPIRVFIFDDRVEIISPGKLPNSLTVEDVKYGNPVIRNNQIVAFGIHTLPFSGLGTGLRRSLAIQPNIELINDVEGEQFIVKIPRPANNGEKL